MVIWILSLRLCGFVTTEKDLSFVDIFINDKSLRKVL